MARCIHTPRNHHSIRECARRLCENICTQPAPPATRTPCALLLRHSCTSHICSIFLVHTHRAPHIMHNQFMGSVPRDDARTASLPPRENRSTINNISSLLCTRASASLPKTKQTHVVWLVKQPVFKLHFTQGSVPDRSGRVCNMCTQKKERHNDHKCATSCENTVCEVYMH